MSANFPNDARFCSPDDIRVRPVPEWGCLLVYTPSSPNLHYLDGHSWFIFELCNEETYEQILTEFHECTPDGTSRNEAELALRTVLTTLLDKGVVVEMSEQKEVSIV